jgi:hypothetical protein
MVNGAIIGSANMTFIDSASHYELNTVLYSRSLAMRLEEDFACSAMIRACSMPDGGPRTTSTAQRPPALRSKVREAQLQTDGHNAVPVIAAWSKNTRG